LITDGFLDAIDNEASSARASSRGLPLMRKQLSTIERFRTRKPAVRTPSPDVRRATAV